MSEPRLYLEDSYLREFSATVVASADGWCALTQTAFHPGGGGQPADVGWVAAEGEELPVSGVREDEDGRVWHQVGRDLPVGSSIRGCLDWARRYGVMRHHCLLHVVNTVAFQRFAGRVTGAQIGFDRSRVDLSVAGFTRADVPNFEAQVNEVLRQGLRVAAALLPESVLDERPELVRTLNVRPPVVNGAVRIVEIEGFDAQACGGTHVHTTREIGEARITKFDNRGKDNKRFYWELGDADPPAGWP
jgi:misacylated tRNA(Ala) deacylase